jgi:hypothetical protein
MEVLELGVSARATLSARPQNSQILWSVVLSGADEILVENNVERPMQSDLYALMLAHDPEKFGRFVATRCF